MGPGIADLPLVAVRPISFSYSGVMLATAPVPRVAICQMPTKARNSAIDTIAARKRREEVISLSPLAVRTREEVKKQKSLPSRCLPDLEAVEIVLGLRRVEGVV